MKYDVVIIGGGLAGLTAGLEILKAGKSCAVVSEGRSLHECPRAEFIAEGGKILAGDSVTDGVFGKGRLTAVHTRNLGKNTSLEADSFILATGKFMSRGLVATMTEIIEPLFGCSTKFVEGRDNWLADNFFDRQPFEEFGVVTDSRGRVSIDGKTISNLYAAGEILAGNRDIVESAVEVAAEITGKNAGK